MLLTRSTLNYFNAREWKLLLHVMPSASAHCSSRPHSPLLASRVIALTCSGGL
jgi:hypothetical protein